MNLRIMTIGSVFSIVLGVPLAALAADDRNTVTNPLRGSNGSSSFEDSFDRVPTPSAAETSPLRSPPGLWRNPGLLRTPEGPPRSGVSVAPGTPSPPATVEANDGVQPPAAPPARTLIQRIRDRRLTQLEKQAQRLRELSLQDGQRPSDARNSANPNGPENPDLQIDIGLPLDAPDSASANPPPSDTFSAPRDTHPVWSPDRPTSPTNAMPSELNPPADPPIDIQIEVPGDPVPLQPKPPIQARLRNWWAPTVR
jgi:hypothetical protein